MNSLENVFIHEGKGHPLYFQTFHGHSALGKHALKFAVWIGGQVWVGCEIGI